VHLTIHSTMRGHMSESIALVLIIKRSRTARLLLLIRWREKATLCNSQPSRLQNNRLVQGCNRYFPKVSPIFDIDAGFKSIVDTDIDTLP